MKKTTSVLFIALVAFLPALFAQQKIKLGHINSNELLSKMPERKEAETKLQEEAKKLETQLSVMTNEYQTKFTEYQSGVSTMSDIIKQTKTKELGDLEARIQDFRENAQQALQKKESELLKPIIDKAKKAIDEVSKENGYTYVFDSGVGFLLHTPDTDDLMPLVMKKLGLVK